MLAWALGVETRENGLVILRRNAGALIFDTYPSANMPRIRGDRHDAVLRAKGDGIVDQVPENLPQSLIAPQNRQRSGIGGKAQIDGNASLHTQHSVDVHKRRQQAAKVDWLRRFPTQLGI